ncbi:type 1 periplasmic-binding domain-containing protein [Streptomyces daliensis]
MSDGPPSRYPSRWRPLWRLLGALVCLAVITVTVRQCVFPDPPAKPDLHCAPGVVKRGKGAECVGVTDGAYVFSKELREVTRKIRAENAEAEKSGDWVAVAYTEPMTRRGDWKAANDRGADVVRQSLEGAYLAQMKFNHTGGEGRTPKIKLLLANSGQSGEQWKPMVRTLAAMADDPEERLVGVAGFGQSVKTTELAVEALREKGVPMVGSTVAAESLSTVRPMFFRVASTTSDQAAAAAEWVRERRHEDKDLRIDLVVDNREKEEYAHDLSRYFQESLKKTDIAPETPDGLPFVSGTDSAATALASYADRVCRPEHPLDAVYFAGRGRELKLFIEALADPRHADCDLTVLSGSSSVGVFFEQPGEPAPAAEGDLLGTWEKREGLTVLYTAYAHPSAPADIYDRDDPYPDFERRYTGAFGGRPQVELGSGQAMMGYDAVYALAKAVRNAAGPAGDEDVDEAAVHNMLLQLGQGQGGPVHGLSGEIAFDSRGRPRDRAVPLVELRPEPGRHYTYRDTLWP